MAGASLKAHFHSRRRDLIELGAVFTLILAVVWTPHPMQARLWMPAVLSVVAILAFSFDGRRAMGLCTTNLLRSFWAVPAATGVAVCAILLAIRFGTLRMPESPMAFLRHYGGYVIWAGIQQMLLQCFFLARCERLTRNATAAAFVAAALFAIAHLPNPVLTVITLLCGFASCLFFLRYHNLWPLALAHAILGISIAITIPGQIDHNMRVGISYMTWGDRPVLTHAMRNIRTLR